jgi:hypothetical protein
LRRELDSLRQYLSTREQELVAKVQETARQSGEIERLRRILGESKEQRDAAAEAHLASIDDLLQRKPTLLKRVRTEELLLVKPFIRPQSAQKDFQNGLYILQELNAQGREFDWARHYFFEPLHQLEDIRKLHTRDSAGKLVSPRQMLYTRFAQEFSRKPRALSLVQAEALLHRMMRRPLEYQDALRLMHQRGLALSQVWPTLGTEEASALYGDMLLHRLRQYTGLSKEEQTILQLRTESCFDDHDTFKGILASGKIPNSERISQMYARITALEKEDLPQLYPVNLRWYARLPQDLDTFLQDYRRKPHAAP